MHIAKECQAERLIARRYEERGYTVTLAPARSAIPFKTGKIRPGLLATNGTESILIEVKTAGSRGDAEAYHGVIEQTRRHPGWKFLLATVTEEELANDPPILAHAASEALIRARLQSLDGLGGNAELKELLLPPLWTSYVGSLVLLLAAEGVKANGLSEFSLLNAAYTAGLISFEEHETGKRLLTLRNRAIHSLEPFDASSECRQLRRMIDGALAQLPQPCLAAEEQ